MGSLQESMSPDNNDCNGAGLGRRSERGWVKRMQVRTAGGKFMVKGADKFFA